ncbi:MAG: glycosyltransferase [Candidatus Aminicenantes bacterium]|nr:glycosyltransferase [Candidatus Aminicenantes bacterium]
MKELSLFHVDAGREWRGGQRQVLFLVRELKRKGFPVYLVVQPDSPLERKAREENLVVIPLKMKSEADLWASFRLARLMRKKKCQLAHFHEAHSLSLGLRAASWAKVPILVAHRRVDFPVGRHFFSRRKYGQKLDAIIAISEGVKKVLIEGKVPPEKITVIPSGIDFSVFDEVKDRDFLRRELSFAPDDFLVGIVAALEDHKGHTYLFQATKIVRQHSPKIKLIVVGTGSLRLELESQAHELGIEDIVFFLGFREDIPRILASLDLFVLSSHLEGLGSSLLDAMASRLPIVATRAGGIPEIVRHGETGLLVPPKDPETLAKAIIELYHDRKLANYLAEKGREFVRRHFSAEAMANRVVDLYFNLAQKKGVSLYEGRQ